MQELKHFGQRQVPSRPCWSPDGTRLAFALVTAKGASLKVMDLIQLNIKSDVASIRRDGTGVVKLTQDGRGGAPAWGP